MSTASRHTLRLHALALGLSLALTSTPVAAQAAGTTTTDPHAGHTMTPPADPKKKKPAAATPAPAPAKKKPAAVDPHAGHVMPAPAPPPAKKKPAVVDPHAGHVMPAPAPARKKPTPAAPAPAKKPAAVDPHAGHVMPAPAPAPAKKKPPATPAPARDKKPASVDPHAGHTMPPATPVPADKPVAVDPHAGHTMSAPADKPAQPVADPHAGHTPAATTPMDHAAMGHEMPLPDDAPRTPIPLLTDADRAAAFPPVGGHAAHDKRTHSYWELDRLEAWDADPGTGVGWKGTAWIGGDIHRVWLRSEGEQVGGDLESADLEVLGGRSVSRWWDVVAGVRHELGEGPSQTFAAVGVQGLTPYKFDMEATAYIGSGGQTAARIEAEYDTLLTNRWILQWHGELEAYGKDDPQRGRGAGLSTIEAGVRLRFEVTRKFAPYIGIVHERSFGDTADFRRADGEPTNDTRVVAGVRLWF